MCLYVETVADYVGVSRITLRGWLRLGKAEADRLAKNKRAKPRASEKVYLEFFYLVRKCLAEGQIYDSGVIKKAEEDHYDYDETTTEKLNDEGKVVERKTRRVKKLLRRGDWQAAAWRLERRFPDQWGRKDKMELDLLREAERVKKMSNEQLFGVLEESSGETPKGTETEVGESGDPTAGSDHAETP